MKDRKYFLREDLDTFKRKFKLICPFSEFKVTKYDKSLAHVKNNEYICKIIKIEEL